MWLIILSDQLSVLAMVGRYPTIKLMPRGPLLRRPKPFPISSAEVMDVCSISHSFKWLSSTEGQVIHVLLTRPPL